MRWVINNSALLLIYAAFIISGGGYLRGVLKYGSVESWPSVEAEIVDLGGDVISFPTQSRFGFSSTLIDSRFVEFRYSVEGNTYRGTAGTPDGGGLPINPWNQPLRAFYKPSSPEVAVLAPVPFKGTGLLAAAGFSGILVLGHLWFTLPSVIAKK